jgi:hypothetical protein
MLGDCQVAAFIELSVFIDVVVIDEVEAGNQSGVRVSVLRSVGRVGVDTGKQAKGS